MRDLWEVIHLNNCPQTAREESHAGETICVRQVWEKVKIVRGAEAAPAHPLWGKAVLLRPLRPEFPMSLGPEHALPEAHQGAGAAVRGVQQDRLHKAGSATAHEDAQEERGNQLNTLSSLTESMHLLVLTHLA